MNLPTFVRALATSYTEAELRAMPDYVVRYLAPCFDEVRQEHVRRYKLERDVQKEDTFTKREQSVNLNVASVQ